jgi:hypothetical protein
MGGVEVDVLLGQFRREELGEGPGLHVIGYGPTIAPRPGSRLPYQYGLPRSGLRKVGLLAPAGPGGAVEQYGP